jgi:acyl carrier protein
VAEIWREVLGAEPSLDDNFFDLGGHSLLLLRVHRRVQEAFGVELPLTEMFRHPTVAALSELVGGAGRGRRSFAESAARAERKREARRPEVARRRGR